MVTGMDNKPENSTDAEHLIGYDEFDKAGTELIKKRKRKQRIGMVVLVAILVVVGAGSLAVFIATRQDTEETNEKQSMNGGRFGGNEGVITASGTTSIGVDAVTFDIDFLEDTSLYVEEVYLSTGDVVEAGTKYVKFTEDSIAEAREELESTAESADLVYRSSVITTNESKIQAKYTYQQAILTETQAEAVYNETLASLQAKLDSAQKDLEEAQEDYNELYNQIANDTFYADYEVAEKKEAYEDAYDLYVTKMNDWEKTEDDLESSSSSEADSNSGSNTTAGGQGQMMGGADGSSAGNSEEKWITKTLNLLKEEAEEAESEYEQALSDYEDAVEHAELNLSDLANKLETAQENYTAAELSYQKESLSAKTTYETALAKSQTAQTDYDTQLTSLQESLDKLQDAKTEADENLALFESLVGDGYFYTPEAGTVLMIRAEEGEALTGGDMILAYSNPEEITVSVSVSQDYISQLSVGDRANVTIADYGNFTGTIQTINPVSSSDSRTSVAYTVEIALEGDVSELSANLTATVVFGADGNMPGGMEKPADGKMPEGMEAPAGETQGQEE